MIAISKDYLTAFAPKNLALQLKGKSQPIQLFREQHPMIRELLQQMPTDKVSALIEVQFLELDKFLALKNNLSEEHLMFIAEGIIDEFSEFTMLDIAFIIRKAKMGAYGEFYNRLNPTKIFTWIREYKKERLNAQMHHEKRTRFEQNQAEERKRQEEFEAMTPEEQKELKQKRIDAIKQIREAFSSKK